jgi:hypothetical protein
MQGTKFVSELECYINKYIENWVNQKNILNVEEHPSNICTKFGSNWACGFSFLWDSYSLSVKIGMF